MLLSDANQSGEVPRVRRSFRTPSRNRKSVLALNFQDRGGRRRMNRSCSVAARRLTRWSPVKHAGGPFDRKAVYTKLLKIVPSMILPSLFESEKIIADSEFIWSALKLVLSSAVLLWAD